MTILISNLVKRGDIYRFSWPICVFCLHSFSFDRFIRSAIPNNRASLMSCIVVYGTRTKVQPKSRPSVNSGLMLTLDCTICHFVHHGSNTVRVKEFKGVQKLELLIVSLVQHLLWTEFVLPNCRLVLLYNRIIS